MKKTKTFFPVIFAVLLVTLFSGCMTTAERRAERISQNQALFMQLAPDAQARVSQGMIAIGDTTAAVWLALGPAGKVTSDTTAAGKAEVWQYFRQEAEDYFVEVLDPPPPPGTPPPPPGWYPRTHIESRTRYVTVVSLMIQFENGVVTRIQEF